MINEIPEDIKLFSSIYAELTLKINEALKSQGLSKKELAEKLEKKPSEISKWLNGEHNFTLRSLCKLQCELGVELIKIPKEDDFNELINDNYTSHESIK
ncbi:helix-turn-helix domain-containing protein [Myroides fluvii]|uniref:helix-turn-helix domain-containing protein n=1 Tax=Myroides fluvii TaxID=2572594 RepID=UPI00131C5A1F|nr:helix-turn-helix transcriptional regulator [Myroides fluvii]